MDTKRCFDKFREPNITRAKYGPSLYETSFQSSIGKGLRICVFTLLGGLDKCSVGPETSISPRGKAQGPTSFSERGLFFSEIEQLSDRGKEQSSRGKGRGRDLFN